MLFFFFSVRKRNQTVYNTGVPSAGECVAQFRKGLSILGHFEKDSSILFNKNYKDQY